MELAIIVWLVGMLKPLGAVSWIIMFLGILATIITLFCAADMKTDEEDAALKKFLKQCIVVTALAATMFIAIPSEKTGWMMIGAYAAQTAVESDRAQKLLTIVDKKLESVLDDLEQEVKNKAGKADKAK